MVSVKFDDSDSFIGASYSSGILRIYNSFSGKVHQTLNFNHVHSKVVATSMKFRHPQGSEREILLTVTTEGKL